MDQDFHARVVRDTDGVLGIRDGSDLAVERRKDHTFRGIDAYAFAQDAGSECVVRNISLRNDRADCGSNDLARVAADDCICRSLDCGSGSCRFLQYLLRRKL